MLTLQSLEPEKLVKTDLTNIKREMVVTERMQMCQKKWHRQKKVMLKEFLERVHKRSCPELRKEYITYQSTENIFTSFHKLHKFIARAVMFSQVLDIVYCFWTSIPSLSHLSYCITGTRKLKSPFWRPLCGWMWAGSPWEMYLWDLKGRSEEDRPFLAPSLPSRMGNTWVSACRRLTVGVRGRSSCFMPGSPPSVNPWNHHLMVGPEFQSSNHSDKCQVPYIQFLPVWNTERDVCPQWTLSDNTV